MALTAPASAARLASTTVEVLPAIRNGLRHSSHWARKSQPAHETHNPPLISPSSSASSISRPRRAATHTTLSTTSRTAQSILRALPHHAFGHSSSQMRCLHSISSIINTYSALTRPRSIPQQNGGVFRLTQSRSFWRTSWSQSVSRNLLAHMEQTANNHPGSATSQNAFYQALLRANMPEIVVERYQTGRYATNQSCDNTYQRALERVGAAETGNFAAFGQKSTNGNTNALTSEQYQAIGQAVSAKHQGGNVSISRQGSASKNEPLYVIVDESMSSTIFKWVKFFIMFGFGAYCTLVLFTLLIEATGMLKKVSGGQNAEAKPELQTTRFSDVHGCDEAKEELQELVEFLKAPDRFSTLGGKLPKGVLLAGPPGTGKTLLARAVAGESGVPFFYMSGSEFDEIYVGVGAKRVRDLFAAARAKAPAIIFIDELDAIGSKRHERDAAYAKQTLNQLLTELDGFDQNSGVIIIGATNFPQSLDKALTRPGRFDRNVNVPLPDVRGRIAILNHHLKNIRIDSDVDSAIVARGCPGFSGAELENVVNQAAVRASKNKATKVTIEDLTWAKDKILMGAERRSAVIQDKDKLMTAYHEGGHALVALLTDASTPLYKATIMPRGHALGLTQMLPELDKVSESKKEIMAQIDVSMGGKVAEELVYGPESVTTGASSDIQAATRLAYHMVTSAGMSDLLGNVDLNFRYDSLSSETKQQIEAEVRRIVEEGRLRATRLLTDNREALNRLAHALVEYETLSKDEMEKVVRGEKLPDKLKVDTSVPIKLPESVGKPSLAPPFSRVDGEGASSNDGGRGRI